MDPGSSSAGSYTLVVRDLGRMPYADALEIQRRLQREVIESRRAAETRSMYLLLVEHDPPVITVSRRRGARQHLTATDAELEAAGVEVAETDRGGDITYHGPGQLVAYPILDLNALGLRLHSYMRFLEQVVIDTLDRFGIGGRRDPGATGVWTDRGKICALGVRVSRWVSMHGLALNVTTNLDHFELIVPCGLAGRAVSSMRGELGAAGPDLERVKGVFVETFADAVSARSAGAVSL
jgi:lipoyl(octanoyl) transferase